MGVHRVVRVGVVVEGGRGLHGHGVGVAHYYLTYKADMLGYHPQVILAGRRINDGLGKYIAEKAIKLMINNKCPVKGATIVVLGITFKEDCGDIRNSRVIDVINGMANAIAPQMPNHITRWNKPKSLAYWQSEVGRLRTYATLRPGYLWGYLNNFLGSPDIVTLTVDHYAA